jgi:hypothetical protein
MKYYRKDPLRELSEEERSWLERISRSQSEPAAHVIRAKEILLVAQGHTYSAATRLAGRKSGDAVCHLVKRFNQEGLNAIQPGHGGGAEGQVRSCGTGTDPAGSAAYART